MPVDTNEKYCLAWNEFQKTVSESFGELRNEEDLCDVTLVSDDLVFIAAHKVVLSASSVFFKSLIKNVKSNSNPVFYLGGVTSKNLNYCLDYMYNGVIHIHHDDVDEFLSQAKKLQIKGIMCDNVATESSKISSLPEPQIPSEIERDILEETLEPETRNLISEDVEEMHESISSVLDQVEEMPKIRNLEHQQKNLIPNEVEEKEIIDSMNSNDLVLDQGSWGNLWRRIKPNVVSQIQNVDEASQQEEDSAVKGDDEAFEDISLELEETSVLANESASENDISTQNLELSLNEEPGGKIEDVSNYETEMSNVIPHTQVLDEASQEKDFSKKGNDGAIEYISLDETRDMEIESAPEEDNPTENFELSLNEQQGEENGANFQHEMSVKEQESHESTEMQRKLTVVSQIEIADETSQEEDFTVEGGNEEAIEDISMDETRDMENESAPEENNPTENSELSRNEQQGEEINVASFYEFKMSIIEAESHESAEIPFNSSKARKIGNFIRKIKVSNLEEGKLKVFELTKQTDNGFECAVCGYGHKQKRSVHNHIEIHLDGLEYKCPSCDKVFSTRNSLNVHKYQSCKKRSDHESPSPTNSTSPIEPQAKKRRLTLDEMDVDSLISKVNEICEGDVDIPLAEEVNTASEDTIPTTNDDAVSQSDKLIQGKVLSDKIKVSNREEAQIKTAELIETVVGGYMCRKCGHISKSKGNLELHTEIHFDGLKLPCKFCDKVFQTRATLATHKSNHHRGL